MKEYLDFDLEIREGGPQEYPVVVDSPGGEAQGQMHFPFDDWELENKLLALENALLRSGGSQRSISPEEQTVQEFGERLFKAVLTGDIRTRYEVSLRVARQQNKGLRLKLHIQPPKLALLPWEFLYDPDSGEYLCFSSSTPLVRYVDLSRPIEQLPVTPPLRILGMVASPTDLPQLDVDKEKRLVEEAIKVLREKGLVELTWLEEQTWSALQEKMWGGPWHIFHFVGHGDFDRNNGEGRVAFSDEAGHQVILPARNLARLLDDHRDLRLTFLNSCEGARGGEGDPFSGTAATLVRRGVPAVLAMQYQITDKAAIAFSRAFYHAVANNLPVDAAVAAARTAVSMYDTLEWGTPVLYMRSPDGRLFDIKKEETVEKESFRRYREYVQTSWTHGELREKEAKGLKEFANELELPPSAAADIEREVMGETKEGIIERREQAAGEEEHQERLDQLYARARRSHQNQEWHAVVDVFKQISEVDQDYPDDEGLLQSALEALMRERKERDALRRYREAVKSTWKEGLNEGRAQSLRDLANKLELSASAASRIEQEVMDDTKEAILERLEGLYDEARQLHQNREWQAVIDTFSEIHAEDSAHPDPDGLLASAREALKLAQKKEDAIRQYREDVESAWADAVLDSREVERLRDLADKLDLSSSHTGEIERTVTGDTKEAILESQERAAKERYRKMVEEAWADNHVSDADTEQLGALARELDLSMDIVVAIERDVMSDTKEAILERQVQAARQKEQLDELYARARRSHQDQEWQTVLNIFEQVRAEDQDYPDPEGLLASARESLEIAQKKEDAIRQYREGVESAWTSGELDRRQAEQLRDLANELGLTSSAVADVEREVMGDTIEEILERHEQAARKERQKHLDGLYGRAHALHRDRKWQAVLDIFAEIHAEDSAYPDPEELLQSARNALERTRKEQDTIHRYREAVVWAWVDEDLHGREVKRLMDLVNRLELSSNTAASIEREIMGETKEAILDRHEQASAEHYRTAVEEASTDNELSNQEGVWLRNLASELGLSTDTAADIEREVTGDTIPAILQRQRRLDELYTQARQSYEDQEWQSVVDVFERIHSEVPAFPDPEGLLASAREALDHMRKVADLYDQALRYVDGSEWQQALECLEEAQRLEPGYRDTEELLSRVRRELASPPTAKVPDLSGRAVSQASRVLASRGLKLGARSEAPSDTVSKGLITGQSPEAGRDVQAGSLVSVTISSGPSTVDVPNLVGSGHSEAKSTLEVAGLELGSVTFAPSDDMPEDRVVQQSPVSGEKVTRGSSVRITLSLGLQKVVEQTQRGPRLIDGLARICAKYTGNSYYVDDAITEEKLSNARSSFPISATERVVALLDVTRDGSGKYGLAICEKGIRWCNERTSSGGFIYRRWRSTQRGTLQWSEFADTHIDKHSGHNVMPIEIGENNIFFMTRIAMDPDDLVQLLSELQTFLKVYTQQGFTLSGDSKERIEELGVDLSQAKGSDTGRHITVEDLGSTANHREQSDTAFSVKGVSADRAQHLPLTNTIMASNADQINRLYTLGHTYEVNAVEFSPDSKLLACGSAHATVGLWRVEDPELLHGLVWHAGSVNTVAFSPDGKLLASGSRDATVGLWRVEDPELLHGLVWHVGSVNTVAFSPDGKLLASGSEDRAVRLWRVEDGAPLRELEEHKNRVNAVAFSPDGKLLASGSGGRIRNDDTVRLWRVEDGELVDTLEGHPTSINTVAFSADGKLLASVSIDGTVRIWQVDDVTLIGELRLHQARSLLRLVFSPDGKLLASGSEDRAVRLWRVEDGAPLRELEEHTSKVNTVAFSPDGKLLASGSDDKTVRLWGIT